MTIEGSRLQSEITRLRSQGLTQQQVADELGVSRVTVNIRERKSIEMANSEDIVSRSEWRDELLSKLEQLEAECQAHKKEGKALSVKAIDRMLTIIALQAKLTGAFAPDRLQVSTVKGPGYELLEHSHGLTPGQLEQVYEFMDALPRVKTLIDLSGFVEQKQLEDGK